MRRISTFRIAAIVLVAVAAAGAGLWLSLREEQPAPPNIGTQSDREAIMRLALSKAKPDYDYSLPPPPPPRPGERDTWFEAMEARRWERGMRLADATLAVCSDSIPGPHCLDSRFLLDWQPDLSVPPEFWSLLVEVNAKHEKVPNSVGDGIKRIHAADVHDYYRPAGGCFLDENRVGFDVVWVGQPVFTPDGDSALIAMQLDGYQWPNQTVYLWMYRRENSIWKEVQSVESPGHWNGMRNMWCQPM